MDTVEVALKAANMSSMFWPECVRHCCFTYNFTLTFRWFIPYTVFTSKNPNYDLIQPFRSTLIATQPPPVNVKHNRHLGVTKGTEMIIIGYEDYNCLNARLIKDEHNTLPRVLISKDVKIVDLSYP